MYHVAGFRPGSRPTFVLAKVGKTIDAPPGRIGLIGREGEETGELAALTHAGPEQERAIMGTGGRRRSSHLNCHSEPPAKNLCPGHQRWSWAQGMD
jgi:hypothetical protein